ncbi:MAG: DNA translocase FtsK 4TM domain-containing protein [bacterium]|nr:DNA translocase FtsK 4TM domain-containing protein [bacterium]
MAKPPKKRKSRPGRAKSGHFSEIFGLLLLALSILTFLALATYQRDFESIFPRQNILHNFGDQIAWHLIHLTFGRWPSFVFPILLLLWAFTVLFHLHRGKFILTGALLTFIAFWASFLIFLVQAQSNTAENAGLIGQTSGIAIVDFMGTIGAWTVWIFIVLVGMILALKFKPSKVLKLLLGWLGFGLRWLWNNRSQIPNPFAGRQKDQTDDSGPKPAIPDGRAGMSPPNIEVADEGFFAATEDLFGEAKPLKSVAALPAEPYLASQNRGEYQLPPLSLLKDSPPESPDAPEELKAKAQRLGEALSDFGVGAKLVKVNPGPVITRFDLEPDPGVKVSRISALADDLALVLRARAIRIQAPIPGQGAVGIEIPNRRPSTVALKAVASHSSFQEHPSPLAVALGVDATGEPYISDLGRMPHLLVAGTTGSGKSVCLHAIISSLLLRNLPDRVKLVIIDPKKLEFSNYARLARHHLMTSEELDEEVITTPANAIRVLKGVELEMATRYDMLAGVGVRNIEEFNLAVGKGNAVSPEGEPLKPLPYLVVVIDELADLMMIAAKEVEEPIARLAQMARAVGIHLIVATQRPSVDVITGVIKANFPARLAFQVASKTDSRTILDANGADTLLGNGDALFIPPGRGQPERIHCCFVDHSEIEGIISHIEDQPEDLNRTQLRLPLPEGIGGEGDLLMDDVDELFEEAARMVIRQGQASVSILQRRLKIGYARAGRLIDQLERAGIVGPFDGSKARDVLVDASYLDSLGGGFPPHQ